jgi:hypothetical protein
MRVGGVVRVVVPLLAAAGLAACADRAPQQPGSTGEPSGLVELEPAGPPQAVETPGLSDELSVEELEGLEYPPVTVEMLTAVDQLREAAGDDPDFGGSEISLDRTRIVLRWYGEVPPAVQEVVDAYAAGPFTVVVEPSRFRPGDLQAEVDRLFREHPGVIAAAGARPTGDGIELMIREDAVAAAGGLDEALADNGVVSEFPLFAEEGSVVPA